MLNALKVLTQRTNALHWLVAIPIIGLFLSGLYMVEFGGEEIYLWHKAMGVVVTVPILIRIIRKFSQQKPSFYLRRIAGDELIARLTHISLIVGTVIMPISGFVLSALGGYGVYLWGAALVARRVDPLNAEKVIPINSALSEWGRDLHHWMGYLMLGFLLLHLIGALRLALGNSNQKQKD